ncbi:MAG: signal peptidase II [Acidobacteriota bacterium]|jgi:signal peptidase II
MKLKNRIIVTALIMFACIGCDRLTKNIAKENLPRHEIISLMHDTVRLQYAENTGAFLSFGANIPPKLRYFVFTILVGIFLCGLLVFQLASGQLSPTQIAAMACVLGGGFGNLIDRIVHQGRVFDFLNMGIGSLRTGVFNFADMSITFGVLWFLFLTVKNRNRAIPAKDPEVNESDC